MKVRKSFGTMVGLSGVLLVVGAVALSAVWTGPGSGPAVSTASSVSAAAPNCSPNSPQVRAGGADGAALLAMPNDVLARELTAAKNAGMFSIRVDIDWSVIEPTRGRRDWSNTDRVVNSIVAHGLCPLGLVGFTPIWARPQAGWVSDSHYIPRDAGLFADFARAAAVRYRDRISLWEIWNEPNIVHFFRPAPNVDQYGQLLRAGYEAIKSVQRNSFILAGGLAPAADNGTDIAPVTFIQRLYQIGANRYFDAFAMHPYTYPALPNDPTTASWSAAQKMWQMRDVMVAGGDAGKQMWITEFGAPTGTHPTAVTEAVQAESIAIALNAAREAPWIGPIYLYSIRDTGPNPADREQNFGLLRHDFSEKLAYGLVRSRMFAPGN
ncbi:beta-xylosidase [Rhodococcus daqingensis]|uniref:Beta-xylosidase n=1 Tax=Rhodococcus daqingensis TaxID=2479363 RepID=A0ABW2RSB8_9NOCA